MTEPMEAPKRRGRPPRSEEVRAERRRRSPLDAMRGKLHVPEHLKQPGFSYRWINDDAGRLQTMTHEDDWEPVREPIKDDADGLGTVVEKFVGRTENGQGMKAVLCKKPTQWVEEDNDAKQRQIAATEQAIKRGNLRGEGGLAGPGSYVPAGGISLRDEVG